MIIKTSIGQFIFKENENEKIFEKLFFDEIAFMFLDVKNSELETFCKDFSNWSDGLDDCDWDSFIIPDFLLYPQGTKFCFIDGKCLSIEQHLSDLQYKINLLNYQKEKI